MAVTRPPLGWEAENLERERAKLEEANLPGNEALSAGLQVQLWKLTIN
jgi:hypothetical protein